MISMLMVVVMCFLVTHELIEHKLMSFSSALLFASAIFFNITSMLWAAAKIGYMNGVAQ